MKKILIQFIGKQISFYDPSNTETPYSIGFLYPTGWNGETLPLDAHFQTTEWEICPDNSGRFATCSFMHNQVGYVFTDLQNILSITKKV